MNHIHTTQPIQKFLTRAELCLRWACCTMTLKRREKQGILKPIRFNARTTRYLVSDIEATEAAFPKE